MKYSFAQHLLLRMPVKNTTDYFDDQQNFLDDQFFLAAIRLATPAFYAILERQQFRLERLTAKELNTLQKYVNRYCFRPTPFGLFSSVTLTEWGFVPSQYREVEKFSMHARVAMPVQSQLGTYFWRAELLNKAKYTGNPTIYRILNEYRFIRTGLDEQGKRDYQLQSIAFSTLLRDLLKQCASASYRSQLIDQTVRSASCSVDEGKDYIDFLIDAQILVNYFRLPITGDDYLTSIADKLSEDLLKKRFLDFQARLNNEDAAITPASISEFERELSAVVPLKEMPQDKLSIILKRSPHKMGPGRQIQARLREGIKALEQLSPSGQPVNLIRFRNSFHQHFEGQTLPLLKALDPEAGIGYQHPELEKNNPLLETLHIPYRDQEKSSGCWTPAHRVLMEAWLKDRSAAPVIRLNDADLAQLVSDNQSRSMLGMSILFREAENKVFIENAGGINAPALLGRFTLADEEIADAGRDMANLLELQNPEIIFAEILHLADPHTDNVNRRAHLYQYELPVTAASTLPEAQQIKLSDLNVRIVDNLVILFSVKHQKVVIPMLSTAYNHSLNKLPLFRFLADLPFQFGRSNLSLDLRTFFPNLGFYPRVEFKNVILSLSTWILTENQLKFIQNLDPQQNLTAFQKLRDQIRLPRYFSLAEGDQELVFDCQNEAEVNFFCNCIHQKKQVVIKELFKQKVVRQYNAYLLPNEPVVLPHFPKAAVKLKAKRKFIPGSEWLYLKIYTPKIGVDRLLSRLGPLIRKRYGEHRIQEWFFIRYEDHASHIRLRLKINPAAISEVLIAFKSKVEDRIQQHVIREFQIDIYSRELERYAAGGIEQTERFFWSSSELILHYLNQRNAPYSKHAFALYSTKAIIIAYLSNPEDQISFTLNGFQQFLPEFAGSSVKVGLDRKYRELSAEIHASLGLDDIALLSGSAKWGGHFVNSLESISIALQYQDGRIEYIRSIIHMHLNRIFTDESRKQEMICYYLLYKYMASIQARKNKRNPSS